MSNVPGVKQDHYYLDRYGVEPEPPEDYGDFDSGFGLDFENPPPEMETSPQPLADDGLLAGMEEDLLAQEASSPSENQTSLSEEIQALESEIQEDAVLSDSADLKEKILKKLADLKSLSGDPEKSDRAYEQLESLRSEFENEREAVRRREELRKAPLSNLVEHLKNKGQGELTVEAAEAALKESGLTLKELQNFSFSTSGKNLEKLFNFMKAVDSHLAGLLEDHEENPYHEEVKDRLAEDLRIFMPASGGAAVEQIDKILDHSVEVSWPSGKIEPHLVGDDYRKYAKGMLNSPDGSLERAMADGDWDHFGNVWLHAGWAGDWDQGRAAGSVQRLLSGVYAAADHNPSLFKRLLRDNIPESTLNEMIGILHIGDTLHVGQGDLLDRITLAGYLSEIVGT